MRPERDRQLSNSKTTSKTRAQQPATRSSFDPIEDVWIRILDPKKGDPIVKELENRKTQVKTFVPRRNKKTWVQEKPMIQSSTYANTQTRPLRVTPSRRPWTNRTKEHQGISALFREKPSLRSSTYKATQTRPERVTPSRRPWTLQDWGTLRDHSPTRASWQAHDSI